MGYSGPRNLLVYANVFFINVLFMYVCVCVCVCVFLRHINFLGYLMPNQVKKGKRKGLLYWNLFVGERFVERNWFH